MKKKESIAMKDANGRDILLGDKLRNHYDGQVLLVAKDPNLHVRGEKGEFFDLTQSSTCPFSIAADLCTVIDK